MALDPTEIVVAGTGSIKVAPVGTAEPADIETAPSVTWVDLGFTTEDGVEFTFDRETTDIMGWQSRDPLRTIATAEPKSVKFTLLQLNKETWKFALGGGTTSGSLGLYLYEPPTPGSVDERALMIEMVDGAVTYRFIARRGMQQGAVAFSGVRDDATSLPIDFKVLAAPEGVTHPWVMQTNDADFA